MSCVRCGSYAINRNMHGRDGSDLDLCDVCYWRKRADVEAQQAEIERASSQAEQIEAEREACAKACKSTSCTG